MCGVQLGLYCIMFWNNREAFTLVKNAIVLCTLWMACTNSDSYHSTTQLIDLLLSLQLLYMLIQSTDPCMALQPPCALAFLKGVPRFFSIPSLSPRFLYSYDLQFILLDVLPSCPWSSCCICVGGISINILFWDPFPMMWSAHPSCLILISPMIFKDYKLYCFSYGASAFLLYWVIYSSYYLPFEWV